MKKHLSVLILFTVTLLSFSSCNKDNPQQEQNLLVGTKWCSTYSDYLMVLEFTSATEVTAYFAKENGVYDSGKTTSPYTLSGNKVTFSDLTLRWIYAYYKFETASLDGALLSVSGQYTFNISSGEWAPWSKTFSKP